MKKILIMFLLLVGILYYSPILRVEAANSTTTNSSFTKGSYNNGNVTEIDSGSMTCEELLGSNMLALFKLLVNIFRFACFIICIINGMTSFLPAITGKNSAEELRKATRRFVKLLIIFAVALMLPSFARMIGEICGFDVSCL